MGSFAVAQTFFLDKAQVKDAYECGISRVDLFFRGKPRQFNNKSGIFNPGVEVSIVPCINGVPNIVETGTIRPPEPTEHGARFAPRYEIARLEWHEITASRDASIATTFEFANPIFVPTDMEYAILIKFDGDEDFVLWYSKKGDPLVNSETISLGASGKYTGNYYVFVSSTNVNLDAGTSQGIGYSNNALDPVSANSSAVINASNPSVAPDFNPDIEYLASNWRASPDIDLKFNVYVARYYHNGFPVTANATILADKENYPFVPRPEDEFYPNVISNNIIECVSPHYPIEYITFDLTRSYIDGLIEGETLYQDQIRYPGGTATPLTMSVSNASVNVVANGSYLLSNGISFNEANGVNNLIRLGGLAPSFIFFDHGNKVDMRIVTEVYSNTEFRINHPASVSNNAAKVFIAPMGKLFNSTAIIRNNKAYQDTREMMVLNQSTANSTLRFANHTIIEAIVANGGSGYSNSDHIVINGYENAPFEVLGGYPATANLVTDASGVVQAIYMSNSGCGFVNTSWISGANITIANSVGGISSGNGLVFLANVGASIKSIFNANTHYENCEIINLETHRLKPEITINNPLGTSVMIEWRNHYKSEPSNTTFIGRKWLINEFPERIPVKIFASSDTIASQVVAVTPSRSNQFVIGYANGALPTQNVIGKTASRASEYIFSLSSNNDYLSPFVEEEIINSHHSKYLINDDYTNENTNYGNAIAKHVTTRILFQADRWAEDLLIWFTAYRPAGTRFKVFARIYNSKDSDAFDDKDWTLLEETDGETIYSSDTDQSDFIELEYSLPYSPNTAYTCNGSVSIANVDTVTITGVGTQFLTELANNDLVKIRNPLFNNSFAIVPVVEVVNNTTLTINAGVANNGMVGDGFLIDKIAFKKQAFKNILNSNIVRYYNEDMVEFDTYDTVQYKVCFLSNSEFLVPKIEDIRGTAVSA